MKKLIFIFIILCSIFFIKDVEAKNTFCYTIGTTTYCIDSVVIAASDCSTYIESGVLCRDTDNDTVYVGNGTAAVAISGSSSGDVQSAGDCLGGACYDGSSDGGTYVRLYDGDSNYTAIVPSNTSSNVTITLPTLCGYLRIGSETGNFLAGNIKDVQYFNGIALTHEQIYQIIDETFIY
jgi:hypothetical protein